MEIIIGISIYVVISWIIAFFIIKNEYTKFSADLGFPDSLMIGLMMVIFPILCPFFIIGSIIKKLIKSFPTT